MEPTSLRAAALIPAAGRAKRFNSSENKIWAQVAGRTVLEWTLSAFDQHPAITSLVVVAGEEESDRVRAIAAAFPKMTAVVVGGETRAASVKNGLASLPADTDIVLVHDAARPLITAEVITRVLEATARTGAAVPGLPLSDTVKRVDTDGLVRATLPRTATIDGIILSGLTAVQTPQGALVSTLRAAYTAFDFTAAEPTDEASLIEAFGSPVAVVPGDPTNIKITRQEDLTFAERLITVRKTEDGRRKTEETTEADASPVSTSVSHLPTSEIRTGFGYDVHAFAPPDAGRKLVLGGIEISHDRGLDGHSDADVLLHAVCDALLGAASLGDIGILFPNTDPAYKGISSLRLLKIVGEKLQEAGWQVVNMDATVVAEAPKLMPHRDAIQRAIGDCLGIDAARVSVKATTSEKMGFVGREEGIACWAVATVRTLSHV
jgi:2-C-methyl-D-erythritol 4-phosphate cytidylyltransferase / 2-C-methyl-D-erythritol 2,4-cyclodiphosphate synthase